LDAIGAALQAGTSKAAVCRTFEVKRTTLYDALARVDASTMPSVEDRL
jgi:transposase-like protein